MNYSQSEVVKLLQENGPIAICDGNQLLIDSFFEIYMGYWLDFQKLEFTMEDKDRGLTESDSLSKIKKIKVAKRTAIPYGTYRVILSFSKKLGRFLPLILDVPGSSGIRVHKGSTEDWSSGCVLVGMEKVTGKLKKIVEAEKALVNILKSVNEIEPIYIKIVKDGM